ncbi:MAG: CvpA family protein [Bryobacteraceae bacterium]|jgi:membrane protein required for colicin V production
MNWIDGLLILVVGLSILTGFAAGFARVGVGFIATVLGIFLGFWCYGIVGAYVQDYVSSRAIANLVGFLAIFIGVALVGAIVGSILARFFKWIGLSWFDRLLGGAFGAVRGIVIAVALVTVLLAFSPSPPPRSVTDSKLLPYVAEVSNVLALITPREIKDAFRDTNEKAHKVWSENARRQPEGLRRE